MATWAEGNFDSDSAMDFVSDIARELRKEMSPPEEVEDLGLVMAAVAMLQTLVEHCHAPAPKIAEIESLRKQVLSVYDEQIDGLDPDDDFKEKRRGVIEKTFDEFLELLKQQA